MITMPLLQPPSQRAAPTLAPQDVRKWFYNRQHKKKNVSAGLATGGTAECADDTEGAVASGAERAGNVGVLLAGQMPTQVRAERAAGATGSGPRNAEVPWTREEDEMLIHMMLSEGCGPGASTSSWEQRATRHGRGRTSEDLAERWPVVPCAP